MYRSFPATLLAALCTFCGNAGWAQELTGTWTLELDTGRGRLPVELQLEKQGNLWTGWFVNGVERIAIPKVTVAGGQLLLELPHYDSRLVLNATAAGRLLGHWKKRRGSDEIAEVAVHGSRAKTESWDSPEEFVGRWAVRFSGEADPSVAVLEAGASGSVHGTFLTTTGDYRYLSGGVRGGELTLSCFDGAHAFLFHALLTADGKIDGDFSNGNWWHTTWSARRDANASLPDAFKQTNWTSKVELADLAFPNLEGSVVSLADASFGGKCRIIEVFGSWCPNCHDAGEYLTQLHHKYAERGLSIVGLAFELTGDFQRDARQVRRFVEKNQTPYPILIAGTSDKTEATKTFPVLDRVRSYPTMIFLDGQGTVRAIYTGFSGPATGEAHQTLKRQFEAIIEEMLDH